MGGKVVESDMGDSQLDLNLFWGHVPGLPPKSTPMFLTVHEFRDVCMH